MTDTTIAAAGPRPPALRLYLAAEFIALFIAVPVAFALGAVALPMIPTLLAFTAAIFLFLLLDRSFDKRQLWAGPGGVRSWRRDLGRIVASFVVLCAGLGLLVWLFEPERLFSFPRERPRIWALVMVLYPIFSVYPQEIVWRAFLHHRYRPLFPTRWRMIAASAAAFGIMHIVFQNWIAVALTFAGGALFAYTYERTRSTLAVSIEHALYGCFIFTIGLGWYFYGGAVRG